MYVAPNSVSLDGVFPKTPEWTLNFSPQYAFPIRSGGTVTLRADYSYKSKLFHDVGKPRTRGYQEGKGTTFHHHDAVGARMTKKRMTALRYSNDDVAAVTALVDASDAEELADRCHLLSDGRLADDDPPGTAG